MLTLTLFEAAALGIGLLATILLLVGGVLVAFPRATQSVPATVACPILHQRASVELLRDTWTLRLVDVTRCSRSVQPIPPSLETSDLNESPLALSS